ncbi:hypothetical protein B0T22DRAFT_32962 [Podospora appendiculata]|uniref:Zn(2)-C6 fungal-type domain-containing protein n=1 Tax=Podospora appendiculata TaxID=314037 RepID=A0AAE1CFW8_9PEZI|nr:hypothetical protein B0T22DRAFT_32962 [Podospora appendiculata]
MSNLGYHRFPLGMDFGVGITAASRQEDTTRGPGQVGQARTSGEGGLGQEIGPGPSVGLGTAVRNLKRRRPALACEQCRRRKIKCDRATPCGPCQRSQLDICTFRPEWYRGTSTNITTCVDAARASAGAGMASVTSLPGPRSSGSLAQSSPMVSRLEPQLGAIDRVSSRDLSTPLLALASPVSEDWQRQLPGPGTLSHPHQQRAGTLLTDRDRDRDRDRERGRERERPQSSAASDASFLDMSIDGDRHMTRSLDGRSTAEPLSQQPQQQQRRLAPMHGCFVKSRFYGPSHWINASGEFGYVLEVQREAELDKSSDIQSLLNECKRLCRICKSMPYARDPPAAAVFTAAAPGLADSLPPQRTCDGLVRLYLRTFESVYRVLHVPTFRMQYASFWASPQSQSANSAFTAQLLLVCALGSCFCQDKETSRASQRASALRWISTAHSWMSSPSEKSRLNISGLQTQCLRVLAKQAYPGGPELVWISAGSLVRAAMQLGLHHDPSKLPGVGGFEAEMRRRLWATILDLQIQSSIESGGSPLISRTDYDCEPPSNLDDAQLDPDMSNSGPCSRPASVFTDTSMQCALMRTLPIRLEVAKYLNDFSSEQTYAETLRLGHKLRGALEEHTRLFRSFTGQHQRPSPFQIKLFELLTFRFLLALHFPFAIRAKKNPTYYFSHKVCLDLSLSLLHYSSTSTTTASPLTASLNTMAFQPPEDDYTRLRVLGSGIFRDSPLRAVIFVCIELLMQMESDADNSGSGNGSSLQAPLGQFPSIYNALGRQELHKVVAEYVQLLARRIEAGETTVRGHVFFSGVLAHLDALQAGRPARGDILAAMRKSLEFCQGMLKAIAQEHYAATAASRVESDGGSAFLEDFGSLLAGAGPVGSSTTSSIESAGTFDSTAWFDFVGFILSFFSTASSQQRAECVVEGRGSLFPPSDVELVITRTLAQLLPGQDAGLQFDMDDNTLPF